MQPALSAQPPPLSDTDLACAVCTRQPGAFETLMRRYNRVLFRAARSVLKDDTEAEDALQDAYLQAYRHLHAYRGDASLRTWLTRIVVNEAIARSRKLARRAEVIELGGQDHDDHDHAALTLALGGSAHAHAKLSGAQFDKAYVEHEVAYHQAVLDTIDTTLVPNAKNAELKALIVKVRPAIDAHLQHAKQMHSSMK